MNKHNPVQVLLNDEELRDLDKLVKAERRRRQDSTLGRATLLRELGMVRVREQLIESRGDRRRPATVPA